MYITESQLLIHTHWANQYISLQFTFFYSLFVIIEKPSYYLRNVEMELETIFRGNVPFSQKYFHKTMMIICEHTWSFTECCCSVAQLCPTLCDPMDASTLGFPVHHQLPGLAQTHVVELVMSSNHLILCHPHLLGPSIFPNIRVFSNVSAFYIRWPKYWSFSFSISPSNEYSGLISFIGWTSWISLQSKGLSRVFCNTTVQKHQFFSTQLSL